ncbi:MAG TPA: beta-galactosidase [Prevotella sp.]|nr:beta-galactosidase [Prevotella sp.]
MLKNILGILVSLVPMFTIAQARHEQNLKYWQFSRDSIHWQSVTIPHDWAISGPFDKKWDLQLVAIEQNGEKEKTEKSGRSGALPWIGKGYYTTNVRLDNTDGRHVELCFDGAMAEPVVYVNGKRAGGWAYGYTPFKVDITHYIKKGNNRIDVSLNNVEESSRWYPGAGLYRPVTLVTTSEVHIDPWKTVVRTERITHSNPAKAVMTLSTALAGASKNFQGLLKVKLLNNTTGEEKTLRDLQINGKNFNGGFRVDNPRLWSPETPNLYTLKITLADSTGNDLDNLSMRFGIRTVKVDSIHGFQLNGVSRKIKGVCLHHDLGPLGAAVNKAAIIRQIKQLKDMGCDAIRTSHNHPSQIQMDVCDSLGMMVMAESFDMWIYPKCKNGYARFFKEWSDRDVAALVESNRNHPSVVMWSIGNEIPEQWSYEGRVIAEHLQNLCHRLDPTRPVTQGMDRAEDALASGFAQVMDIPGFNYRVYKYDRNISKLPCGFLLGSETASTVSSRGVYKFPLTWHVATEDNDGQCSSYDVEWCSWSNLPEEDFMAMEDKPYTIGQFVWTGYDYLGEPTPYDEYWPSRSSYFGIMDLAGLPKDRFYLYRSVWNKKSHTLHVLPHWTWPGREGKVTPVFVYTDYPEAELFVNGKSHGKVRKNTGIKLFTGEPCTPADAEERAKRYRLMWPDVVYEPGELKVVAYDGNGKKTEEHIVRTAGKAAAISLEADRDTLRKGIDDLAYVTVTLVDRHGTELPHANDRIDVDVTGAGSFVAICNGDATSLESFVKPTMKLFNGKLVITVKAGEKKGTIRIIVRDKDNGLKKTMAIKVV